MGQLAIKYGKNRWNINAMRHNHSTLIVARFLPLFHVSAEGADSLSHFRFTFIKYLILCTFLCGPANAMRLITASPSLTEILFQLGKGADVVGASEFSDYPEAAKHVPRIGGMFSPSIEKTVRLRPDWVLIDAFTVNANYVSALRAARIRFLLIRIQDPDTLFAEALRVLKEVYAENDSPYVRTQKEKWAAWSSLQRRKFSYLALTWMEPPIVIGRSTFLERLLSVSGGENLLPEKIRLPYPQVSIEWLIMQKPERVFFLKDAFRREEHFVSQIRKWWPKKPLQIIGLDPTYFARTSFTALAHLNEVEDAQ